MAPQWSSAPVITGSTAKLTFTFGHTTIPMADEWVLTASDGRTWGGTFVDPLFPISVSVLGLPVGTHTFTLTAKWIRDWDPRLPRVMATASAQTTVTIKI